MKILFICGSLEVGKDGVGDYTRRLAGELIRQGYQARILALNDKHIHATTQETQQDEDTPIHTLRMSPESSWKQRMPAAQLFVNEFDPEWLSVQFVPFSFQEKGIPVGLARRLKILGKNRRCHIMFHELWLGIEKESSLKFKLWGWIQRKMISNMLLKTKFLSIHTHSFIYLNALSLLTNKVNILPLFSNIDVLGVEKKKDTSVFACILFGNIHEGAPVDNFIDELDDYCKQCKRKLKITFIGRNGGHIKEWIDVLEKKGIHYNEIGSCNDKRISDELLNCDLGISTTPFVLAEKSGTIASMLDHKLPVIIVARQWTTDLSFNYFHEDAVYEFIPGNLCNVLNNRSLGRGVKKNEVVVQFIKSLKNNGQH